MCCTIDRAIDADVDAVASLWHEGWHDAHAGLVPATLVELRTLGSFRERARQHLRRIKGFSSTSPPSLEERAWPFR